MSTRSAVEAHWASTSWIWLGAVCVVEESIRALKLHCEGFTDTLCFLFALPSDHEGAETDEGGGRRVCSRVFRARVRRQHAAFAASSFFFEYPPDVDLGSLDRLFFYNLFLGALSGPLRALSSRWLSSCPRRFPKPWLNFG